MSNNESINFVDLVNKDIDVARKAMQLFHTVLSFQESFNVIEKVLTVFYSYVQLTCFGDVLTLLLFEFSGGC